MLGRRGTSHRLLRRNERKNPQQFQHFITFFKISKKNIDRLRKLPNVDSIDLYQKSESIDDGGVSVSVPSIRGNYTRDTLGFNGYGVKIGQIENGFPKLSYPEFSNSSIMFVQRSSITI
mgnify:CR=1 FL=1